MKKRDVKYSKENIVKFFRELRDFISYNKKRIAGTTGVAAITSFITFTSAIAPTMGCNPDDAETLANAASNFVNEQTVKPENTTQDIDIPMDTDKPEETSEDNTNVDEPDKEPEENQVEEVNPRDMQAVYGLDFEVPIYTEEEVEQAKYNLQHNYDDYNGYFEEGYSEEQILAIKDDYYIANQDFWYQLYNMTKDFKCKTAYIDGKRIYYLEDKDWYIEVKKESIRIYGDIYGSGFAFSNCLAPKGNEADVPNNIRGIGELSVGPGSYVLIADKKYYAIKQELFEERGEIFDSAKDLEELEHYGFHNNVLTTEYTGYLNGKSLTLE